MDNKQLKIISVEGNIGIGKSTLVQNLDLKRYGGCVDILLEPHEAYNTFLGYHPLDLFYTNPEINALTCQLHIFNAYKEHMEKKLYELSPQCKVLVIDRSIMSCLIFTTTLRDMGYITEFQHDFLTEYIKRNVSEMENKFPVVKPTAYFYLRNNPTTSILNIEKRNFSKENKFSSLRLYLSKLGKNMDYYMTVDPHRSVYSEDKLVLDNRTKNLHQMVEEYLEYA